MGISQRLIFWACLGHALGLQPLKRVELSAVSAEAGPFLNAANYPSFKDVSCNSNGTYICDPSDVLLSEDKQGIAVELKRLQDLYPVTCGQLQNDPVDTLHVQPFYLGVIIAQDWPQSMQDSVTMQSFGKVVGSSWNMGQLYVGQPVPFLKCPNTAMLILLPDSNQAYLSSESCEFLCQATGSGSVAEKALEGLKVSPAAAVLAGIQQAYALLPQASAAAVAAAAATPAQDSSGEANVLFLQRAIFVFSVVALACSAVIGLIVLMLAPGLIENLKK